VGPPRLPTSPSQLPWALDAYKLHKFHPPGMAGIFNQLPVQPVNPTKESTANRYSNI